MNSTTRFCDIVGNPVASQQPGGNCAATPKLELSASASSQRGWGVCAIAGAGALAVRVEQRVQDDGFSKSLGANSADIVLTTVTIGLAGAFATLGEAIPGLWEASKGVDYAGRFIPAGYDASAAAADELAKRDQCEVGRP